jgi:protease-4
MRRFLFGVLAFIGLLTVVFGLAIGGLIWWLASEVRTDNAVPERAILRVVIRGNPSETGGASSTVKHLIGGAQATTLREILNALEQATGDDRVRGLVVDLSDARPSLATAQEIRAAVLRFRAAAKPAFAFADSFGEGGRASPAYYLASAFEQIWMQPSGELGLTGYSLEYPFIADTLKLIGVTPQFSQRHEFKGGIDMFVEQHLTPALRGSFERLLGDLFDQTVDGIASGRKLTPAAVRALIERAPLSADEAKQAGLIDAVGYADEASALIRSRPEGLARIVGLDNYLSRVGPPYQKGEKIALIYGVGPVVRGGDDDESPFGGSDSLSADVVAKAFRQAAADRDVRAIVFRVDSPGGSYVASDTVWREVKRARDAGKPVVASMGAVAASGGYFVSMAADRIVADPATLTGSIGVYSGKFVFAGLWDKLGVHWDQVKVGANAGEESPNRDFTPAQWQRFQASLDRIYADFAKRAGEDRKLPAPKLDEVARGRVWTGRQAVAVGLADATGGFTDALAEAKALARLAPDAAVQLEVFPPERSPLDRILKLMSDLDRTAAATRVLAHLGAVLAPLLERIDTATRARELSTPLDLR